MRSLRLVIAAGCLVVSPLPGQDLNGHLALGDQARHARDLPSALWHYEAALALDSLHYAANWQAALVLVDMGKQLDNSERALRDSLYLRALEAAARAVRVNPQGADGHFMLANAMGRVALTRGPRERVRMASQVRDEALRATELDPRHDGAYHVLGRWNMEIMRLPGITKLFAKTFLGAAVFSEASWENAVRYLRQAVEIKPLWIYHRLELAEALVETGRPEEARAHLEQTATLPIDDVMDPEYKRQAAELLQRLARRRS